MTQEMLFLWRATNELLGRAIAAYEQRNELDARRLEFELQRDVRIAATAEAKAGLERQRAQRLAKKRKTSRN
jgi:hypothetical protein